MRTIRWQPQLALVALCLAGTTVSGAGSTVADIKRAWERREQTLNAGYASWVEEDRHPRGSITRPSEINSPDEGPIPSADVTTVSKVEFIWDGDRVRYSVDGWTIPPNGAEFVPEKTVEVASSDSRTLRQLSAVEYPMGRIAREAELMSYGSVKLIPFYLWVRPLDKRGAAIPLDSCRVLPQTINIQGGDYVVLRKRTGTREEDWMVDPENDYVVRRYEIRDRDRTTVRIDIEYRSDPVRQCIPSGWHVLFLPNGRVVEDCTASVTSVQFGVTPSHRDAFTLAFPAGTWVHDQTRSIEYIVSSNGSERIVTPGEKRRGVTYQQLIHSESGLAGAAGYPAWRLYALWAATLVLLASLASMVIRRFGLIRRTE